MEPVPLSRIAAYLRKSRADGEESAESVLAKHERILQDFCIKTYGAPLPKECFFREVLSGETIASRPVVRHVIRMIEKKEIDGLLIVDIERLSRGDLADAGELSRLFRYSACKIITPTKTYDITDKYDRKFFEMELMRGNEYLEYTKEIMNRGRLQSVKEGNYIGSVPPYGYDKTMSDRHPTIVPDPTEARVVKLIFEWAAYENIGSAKIANRLNIMGIPPRKSQSWSAHTIRGILSNDVYIGKVKWLSRPETKEYIDGKIIKLRRRGNNPVTAAGKHKPLISDDLWKITQNALKTRAHPSNHISDGEIVNPLAGLLYCKCGRRMDYKRSYVKKNKSVTEAYYVCSGGRKCDQSSSPVKAVLQILESALKNTLENFEYVSEKNNTKSSYLSLYDTYSAQEDELRRRQERLCELLESEIYTEELFTLRNKEISEKLDLLAHEKEKLPDVPQNLTGGLSVSLWEVIHTLANDSVGADEKNKFLKKVIHKIIYHREKADRYHQTPIFIEVFYRL